MVSQEMTESIFKKRSSQQKNSYRIILGKKEKIFPKKKMGKDTFEVYQNK